LQNNFIQFSKNKHVYLQKKSLMPKRINTNTKKTRKTKAKATNFTNILDKLHGKNYALDLTIAEARKEFKRFPSLLQSALQ